MYNNELSDNYGKASQKNITVNLKTFNFFSLIISFKML